MMGNARQALRRIGRGLAAAGMLAGAAALAGCGIMMKRAAGQAEVTESSVGELLLSATLDKGVFRPGESVLMRVTVTNTTDQKILVRGLNQQTVTLWYGRDGTARRVQRYPVTSKKEQQEIESNGGETVELAPGESRSRPFLLTVITEEPGSFVAQAQMNPFLRLDSPQRSGRLYSNFANFEVYGERLFVRDSEGLLHSEEAIKLAAAAAPGDVQLTDAMLIEDEMGFYKWWINIDFREPQGGLKKTGYLIDPYQGRVWSEAKPFGPEMKPLRARQVAPRRVGAPGSGPAAGHPRPEPSARNQ